MGNEQEAISNKQWAMGNKQEAISSKENSD
jgi:hypothetical protein